MGYEEGVRAKTVEEILGYLAEEANVNLVGPRFAGKSTVLDTVAERLAADGRTVVRVGGVVALRERPLSALAVAGVEVATAGHPLAALTSAVQSLEDLLADGPSVLLVDDVDDLDPVSAGAIALAHGRANTRVITSSRPNGRRQPEIAALYASLQPAVRVTAAPLGFADAHRLVHELLGGPVEPNLVARLAADTGGLPGLIVSLVGTARRGNRIVLRDGRWIARGELWTTPLAQSIEPFLTELDEAQLDALTLLAFAGVRTLEVASELVGADRLADLDDGGLLEVVDDGERTLVGVFPPLVADHLTREGARTRHALARRRLAGLDGDVAPVGRPSSTALAHRLFVQRWQRLERTHRLEWEERNDPASALALIRAMLVRQARPQEIQEILRETDGAHENADLLTWVALWRSAVGDRTGLARALADLERLQPCLAAAVRAHLALMDDGVTADHLAPCTCPDARSREAVTVVQAELLVAAGRGQEALDLLDGVYPEAPWAALVAEVTVELALVYGRDLRGALARAQAGAARARAAGDPEGIAAHGYVVALVLALGGRVTQLHEVAAAALAMPNVSLVLPDVPTGLVTLAAEAAHWQSQRKFAASLAQQAGAVRGHGGPHPFMSPVGIGATVSADEDATADRLWEYALERLRHGFVPAGVIAGVASLERRPEPDRVAALVAAAEGSHSPLLHDLARYVGALAANDTEEMARLTTLLHAVGLRMYAVRASVAGSILLLRGGDPASAVLRVDTAWTEADLRGRDLCGLFRPFDRAVNLSARERQVAILVARGMSSPEIAKRMVLSARTVENHIFAACRKLGVDGRERLARAARTWLTCEVA